MRAIPTERGAYLKEITDVANTLPEVTYIRNVRGEGPVLPVQRWHAAQLIRDEFSRKATDAEIADYEADLEKRTAEFARKNLEARKTIVIPDQTLTLPPELTQALMLLIQERGEGAVKELVEAKAKAKNSNKEKVEA